MHLDGPQARDRQPKQPLCHGRSLRLRCPARCALSTTLTLRLGLLCRHRHAGESLRRHAHALTQANGSLSFTCNRIDRGVQKSLLVASGLTLRELQAEHPKEVRRYLDPMLFSLTGRHLLRPGAADVYRTFASVTRRSAGGQAA